MKLLPVAVFAAAILASAYVASSQEKREPSGSTTGNLHNGDMKVLEQKSPEPDAFLNQAKTQDIAQKESSSKSDAETLADKIEKLKADASVAQLQLEAVNEV